MTKYINGFTLIELLLTLSLISIIASVVLPISQISIQRSKEQELKNALKLVRNALDEYKRAGDEGRIARNADTTGYPENLKVLTEGVVDQKDPQGKKIYFLRSIPVDPMYLDQTINSENMWGIRSYKNEFNDYRYDGDVYDIYSLSKEVGLNGRPYKDW